MIGGAKGIGIGIDFGIPNQYCRATSKPYIEKDVLDSLRVVASAYGKSNNDADRSIVKNLVDASNPFIISNTAFKLNSGFGEYEQDFTDWKKSTKVTSFDSESIKFTSDITWVLLYHPSSIGKDIPSFKVRIKLYGEGTLYYNYITQEGTYTNVAVKSEIFETPICYNTKYTGEKGVNVGFTLNVISGECSGTIEQIPSFEGAFVTDGVNDLITSTKTVQEMLGGSNELTIVSMVHQVKDSANNVSFTNYIRGSANGYFRNIVNNYDKTGIYGYTSSDLKGLSVVNNILGDKNDYTSNGDNRDSIINGNFSVQGYSYNDGNNTGDFSSVAWYWTVIANKVLTTDQINQVIAYFNLDRTLNPDILCNTIKQGITNENHAEFGDRLIDFSGNGRDIQLNNLAWDGDSGIGKYNYPNWKVTATVANTYFTIVNYPTVNGTYSINVSGVSEMMKSIGLHLELRWTTPAGWIYIDIKQDGVYSFTPPDGATDLTLRFGGIPGIVNEPCNITITQIPSHAGALYLDGINDFGKVTGMPVYKDYTVVTDREIFANIGAISSKNNPGAFVETAGNSVYSFGQGTSGLNFISTRSISYLSKYSYCGQSITAGAAEDGTDMWLGTIRDNDTRFFNGAIYSLMSFPYSMSEFLIERQLKKYKLGTLYPNMVEFRPVIKSNASYDNIVFYYKNEKVENGTYLTVGSSIGMHIRLSSSPVNEIKSITVNGIPATFKYHDANNNIYQYDFNLTSKSPQNINITIDEYIRYEDIVQPYPSLFTLIDYDTEEVYSWGSKLKIGTKFKGNVINLLPDMYEWQGDVLYNGEPIYWNTTPGVVAKEMVFNWNMPFKYLIDNNEPKVILSPRLLRIPNSSYKILGYIPDISGHGNHGKINNSAYAGASGANGYPYDYNNSSFWCDSVLAKVVSGELIEYFAVKNSTGFSNITSGVYKGEIKVTGVTKAISENKISRLRIYTNSTTDKEIIDITQDGNYNIDIKGVGDANRVFFYAIPNNPNESIVVRLTEPIYIEQVGEYEGAYCLDGVDDFVTIPTVTGGKQMLMKVNWDSLNHVLYDQRNNAEAPFCIVAASGTIAYNQRNVGRNTYIDGILNNHILVDDLQAITHNIVLNNDYNVANSNSFIGTNYTKSIYAKMSLYDFMLFDNISTDDKIKELNEYVGIEAKVEKPDYYWDAYGKTNSDADRDTIQQRGIAVGDYDLTNYNHAYEGMSGYNGYPVVFGANKTWANESNGYVSSITSNTIHITNVLNAGLALLYSYVKYNGNLQNIKEIPPFKIEIKGLEGRSKFIYKYLATSDATKETNLYLGNGTHELPKSFLPTEALVNDAVVGFSISPIEEGVTNFLSDITIEVLPEYENGLAYDGITDYSKNANIPVLTDYTYIYKRTIINIPTNAATLLKGADKTNGGAFIADYGNKWQFNFGQYNIIQGIADGINWQTVNSFNGTSINKGENTDDSGITVAKFSNGYTSMVFYKLILYPKTISLLEINFLKNLMEKDEIIDLNNKIFIQE